MNELAEQIRAARKAKGLSQKAVADHIGVSRVSYCYFENGHCELRFNTMAKLARKLELSLDALAGFSAEGATQ